MKVVDASAIVELIANDLDPDRLGDEELAVPHLIDSEVTNVLRRLVAQKILSDKQGMNALDAYGIDALRCPTCTVEGERLQGHSPTHNAPGHAPAPRPAGDCMKT